MNDRVNLAGISKVKAALNSPETCHHDTVALVAELLNLRLNGTQYWTQRAVKSSDAQSERKKTNSSTSTRKIATAKVAETNRVLGQVEKVRFAIEVANSALKSLTKVVRGETGCLNNDGKLADHSEDRCELHQNLERRRTGLRNLSQCASLAFSAISHARPAAKALTYQAESGISSLIGKMMALKQYDLAAREIKSLSNALLPLEGLKSQQTDETPMNKSMLDLLCQDQLPSTNGATILLIITHVHALKIIAASKVESHGSILESICFDKTSRTNSLIMKAQRQNLISVEEACKQLENLSRVLYDLSIDGGEMSSLHGQNGNPMSSFQRLRYQLLANKAKLDAWNVLSKPRSTFGEEIARPLHKNLRYFARSSENITTEQFLVINSYVKEQILPLSPWHESPGSVSSEQVNRATYRDFEMLLEQIAVTAQIGMSRFSENMASLPSFNQPQSSHIEEIRKLSELAASSMRSDANLNEQTSAMLLKLCSQLENLKATDVSEAEEIFISLSTIRRISHKLLRHYTDSVSKPATSIEQLGLAGYIRIILFLPQYLCSYADYPTRMRDQRSQQLFEHRLNMLGRVALPSIDAVLLVAKSLIFENEPSVRMCFNAVDHYVKLIKFLDESQSEDEESSVGKVLSATALHASDVMVSMFLHFNSQKVAVLDPLIILRSSVDILRPLTIEERANANFHGKVERLSRELGQRSQHKEALTQLEEALASYAHVLAKQDVQGQGVRLLVQREMHLIDSSLRRMVTRHLKMAIDANAEPIFVLLRCSNLSYPESMTNFMQESQMLEILSLAKHKETCSLTVLEKCTQLFHTDICRSKPIEVRLRWLGIVLHFAILCGADGATQSQESLAAILTETLKELDGASENMGHLVASCQIGLFLLSGSTESASIMAILNRWSQAVGAVAPTTRSVEHRLFSDQIDLLEILAEYLEYHQMSRPHLCCLELIILSYPPLNSPRPARELESRYRLASQYLSSGLVDQANATVTGLSNYFRDHDNEGLIAMIVKVLEVICLTKLGLSEKSKSSMQRWLAAVESLPTAQYKQSKNSKIFADLVEAISVLKQESLQGDEALYYAKYHAKLTLTIMSFETARILASGSRNFYSLAQVSYLVQKIPLIESPCGNHLSEFWRLGSMLKTANRASSALMRLSTCFANAGQVQDALQYLDQATSVAVRAQQPVLSKRADLLRICLDTLRYSVKTEVEIESADLSFDTSSDASKIAMMLMVCSSQIMTGNHQFTELWIRQIAAALGALNETGTRSMTDAVEMLQHEVESLTLDKRTRTRSESKRLNVAKLSKHQNLLRLSTEATVRGSGNQFELCNQLVIRQAALACACGDSELALNILSKLDERLLSHNDIADTRIIEAKAVCQIAVEMQVLNPIYGGLTEIPLIVPGPKPKESPTLLSDFPRSRRGALSKSRSKGAREAVEPESLTKAKISALLQRGECALRDALLHCHDGSPTYRSHQISDTLCTISTLLCTIGGVATSQTSVYEIIAHLELGRNLAWQRMMNTLATERHLQNLNECDIRAPQLPGTSGLMEKTTVEIFTQRYLKIIPKSWVVIGLSLSEDKRDLRLSRLRRESEPFVVSFPLNRSAEGDDRHGTFAFSDCMQELGEIISAANSSTNNVAVQIKRGAKREWWKRRAKLDQRMKELLISIEELWLGGFRGAFHQRDINKPAFDTLYQKVEAILSKHLPSRMSHAKKRDGEHMILRSSVVELFIGLGSPDEEGSLDDSLLDLWSFVVDIFRFQGERNAHDEIDFDSMIFDMTVALKQYHVSSRNQSDPKYKPHIILILDRHLHSVPWESLPCLHGSSISRLPSLEAMRNILTRPKTEAAMSTGSSAVPINRFNGAYVLNPASDLSHTEETFMPRLTKLPLTWQGLVRVVPEEDQLEDILLTRDVYLYLGHGSGAQFIRGKVIRKLQNCAVALLMGCSSVTMSEAGCFESSGVSMNYLLAGAPAVVGTLWDVTDKDIDRFSMRMLESWGLFQSKSGSLAKVDAQEQQPKAQLLSGDAGTKYHNLSSQDDQNLSLDEAVAEARNACIMRYLNGAAPVVYGLPVSLGQT